ncbi:hypothetical protein [Chryseobacterium rhizosphaerae]|uniref:hypothetical protein n=1 Tax=Chryseobacterium rhizosphaerae TaxID=395937 RepID=UPI0023599B3F|nr:hypothetical protein [Chryseobacterium rhizosphaerae]MDC8101653.1 hypothetical protein [Chryseobacterium rhizosphaerae]
MKIKLLSPALLVVPFCSFAQVLADKLVVQDTRDVNALPATYSREFRTEFKLRNILGVPGAGIYSGMLTISPWGDDTGNKNHQLNFNDGGVYYRNALPSDPQWGSWSKLIMQTSDGTVKIDGKVIAKEVEVKANVWADYVFKKDYKLNTLEEVEKHISEKGHLPNIPSAKEVEKEGINLGEMDAKLLEKIEELTLYSIEQNKQIQELKQQVQQLLNAKK